MIKMYLFSNYRLIDFINPYRSTLYIKIGISCQEIPNFKPILSHEYD